MTVNDNNKNYIKSNIDYKNNNDNNIKNIKKIMLKNSTIEITVNMPSLTDTSIYNIIYFFDKIMNEVEYNSFILNEKKQNNICDNILRSFIINGYSYPGTVFIKMLTDKNLIPYNEIYRYSELNQQENFYKYLTIKKLELVYNLYSFWSTNKSEFNAIIEKKETFEKSGLDIYAFFLPFISTFTEIFFKKLNYSIVDVRCNFITKEIHVIVNDPSYLEDSNNRSKYLFTWNEDIFYHFFFESYWSFLFQIDRYWKNKPYGPTDEEIENKTYTPNIIYHWTCKEKLETLEEKE